MRILFVMRHGGYVRNFESVLRLLAERSHSVELGFERGRAEGIAERIKRGRGDFPLPERLRIETGGAVTHATVPTRDDRWRPLVFALRQSVSYLRYLSPGFRQAEKLRMRLLQEPVVTIKGGGDFAPDVIVQVKFVPAPPETTVAKAGGVN